MEYDPGKLGERLVLWPRFLVDFSNFLLKAIKYSRMVPSKSKMTTILCVMYRVEEIPEGGEGCSGQEVGETNHWGSRVCRALNFGNNKQENSEPEVENEEMSVSSGEELLNVRPRSMFHRIGWRREPRNWVTRGRVARGGERWRGVTKWRGRGRGERKRWGRTRRREGRCGGGDEYRSYESGKYSIHCKLNG